MLTGTYPFIPKSCTRKIRTGEYVNVINTKLWVTNWHYTYRTMLLLCELQIQGRKYLVDIIIFCQIFNKPTIKSSTMLDAFQQQQ